ncbi:hypothetical protein PGT21_033167 [Puccinia graminis f. sp. tritici]|uniref:Uncharacterized protein n=1 Tax=Puccinia graminis f. sp. tritici TaxID=56615 RepID=A0A5B0PZH0_PUCGR|nr:hypothetical protein PGT21_033167 [Puccinia graminis f. sp. tritici]KAA1109373.1 hypothetical protein PGTUg99_031084 [Puccinia graminis f. sp. tritici]
MLFIITFHPIITTKRFCTSAILDNFRRTETVFYSTQRLSHSPPRHSHHHDTVLKIDRLSIAYGVSGSNWGKQPGPVLRMPQERRRGLLQKFARRLTTNTHMGHKVASEEEGLRMP